MKMLKMKKGQGLSLNAVVIAAIVLIVLVVLIMIFTGQFAKFAQMFGDTETSCAGYGGRWCSESCGEHRVTEADLEPVPDGKTDCCKFSYIGECNPS